MDIIQNSVGLFLPDLTTYVYMVRSGKERRVTSEGTRVTENIANTFNCLYMLQQLDTGYDLSPTNDICQ